MMHRPSDVLTPDSFHPGPTRRGAKHVNLHYQQLYLQFFFSAAASDSHNITGISPDSTASMAFHHLVNRRLGLSGKTAATRELPFSKLCFSQAEAQTFSSLAESTQRAARVSQSRAG